MRIRLHWLTLAAFFLCGCGRPAPTIETFVDVQQSGVSLRFPSSTFSRYSVQQEPKLTAQEIGTDIPIGVAPARIVVTFTDKRSLPALEKGPRYFLPARSYISFVPLEDKTVTDFAKSYPQVADAAKQLDVLLKNRPNISDVFKPVPDLAAIDEGQSLRCKVRYIVLPHLSGIAYVTQYSQEDQGNPANNEELAYVFQGFLKTQNSGRMYIDARFAITHFSLPKGIDDANRITRDKSNQYLRNAEKTLESHPDQSFQPSLAVLRDVLATISTTAK